MWGYPETPLLTFSQAVVSNSLRPHGLQPARLLCPWGFLGKNTAVGSHFLLWGIFPTQDQNCVSYKSLVWQADALPLSHQGSCLRYNNLLAQPIEFRKTLHLCLPGKGLAWCGKWAAS